MTRDPITQKKDSIQRYFNAISMDIHDVLVFSPLNFRFFDEAVWPPIPIRADSPVAQVAANQRFTGGALFDDGASCQGHPVKC